MNFKRLLELSQEAVDLEERRHLDIDNTTIHNHNFFDLYQKRMTSIVAEIISISGTVANVSPDIRNIIESIIQVTPTQKEFELTLRGEAIVNESKKIQSFKIQQVSIVSK